MRRGYKINPNSRRAKIMPENARLIRLAASKPELLIGPGKLEMRLSAQTGLGIGSIDKTLRRHPNLRPMIRASIDTWLIKKISMAIGQGCNTISGISVKTKIGRDLIRAILTRQSQWSLLKNLQSASARLALGGKKGAATRTSLTLEKLVNAAMKEPQSLSALTREAGISTVWLNQLRRTQPIADAIALDILSRRRALSPEEKARLLNSRIALIKHIEILRQKQAREIKDEIALELEAGRE